MIDVIDAWLRLAADRIHERAAELTALDQAIGDGDHGTNMDRGFAAIRAMLDAGQPDGDEPRAVAAARLRTAGRTLISTVGGAAGPLYGTALMRAGGAVAESVARRRSRPGAGGRPGRRDRRDPAAGQGDHRREDHARCARAGRRSRADRSRWSGRTAAEVAVAMAEAAEAGALATVPLLATKGRASYLGERSVGHQDPGATSAALLLRALADATAGAGAASVPAPTPADRHDRASGTPTMAHTILIGRAGSPGVGVGRLLVVGSPSPTDGCSRACRRERPRTRRRHLRARATGWRVGPLRDGARGPGRPDRRPVPARRWAPSSRPRRCSRETPASWGRPSRWSRRARAPARRSCRPRPSRPTSSPRSMTTTSGNGRRMSGTWAGGWPRSCPARSGPISGIPMGPRPCSSRRTWTPRRWRPFVPSWSPGSPLRAERRPGMPRSSPARSGSRWCSVSVPR